MTAALSPVADSRSKLGPSDCLPLPDVPVSTLFYGDNLDVLRKFKDETVDLCYIDPPFNSKRTYNQIYNRIGTEDRAQAQAFIDTWSWDDAAREGYAEILANDQGRFASQTVDLFKGLHAVLGTKSTLLAYLVSITLRVTEIHRVLKATGSFYLHCDPTAGHYLKVVLDSIFVAKGGEFLNEILWCYSQGGRSKRWFARKHDTIFAYSKGSEWTFNGEAVATEYELLSEKSSTSFTKTDEDGRKYKEVYGPGKKKLYKYYEDAGKVPYDWWTDIHQMTGRTAASGNEYMGYPTQKPRSLLERIIKASSKEGDVILDAYCGCGTTVAVAQNLGREWIGIDITYQAISLILHRLEGEVGPAKWPDVEKAVKLSGIPRDMASAVALAHKKDDRVRKEFEKWAVLTYTNNRAAINDKKGADGGIDGTAHFMATATDNAKAVFQAKSGGVGRGDVAKLHSDMLREGAVLGFLITLEEPTGPMHAEAKAAGAYTHALMGKTYDTIRIVTVREILEEGRRLELPLSWEVVKKAKARVAVEQTPLFDVFATIGEDEDE